MQPHDRGDRARFPHTCAHTGPTYRACQGEDPRRAHSLEVVRAIEAAGGKALAIRADAGDVAAVKAAVAKTVQTFGRLDILVNNAGVAIVKPVDRWSRMVTPEARNDCTTCHMSFAQLDIDTGCRLIEEEYLRFVRQGLGDQHPALHAAGKRHDLAVFFIPQGQVLEHLCDVIGVGRFAE
jgi:NAD(P)-dependent dehydrogenase (short-subunit alcohol dehydrogenase family)